MLNTEGKFGGGAEQHPALPLSSRGVGGWVVSEAAPGCRNPALPVEQGRRDPLAPVG